MLDIQTFVRPRAFLSNQYIYNGPGSRSSPDFPRTGGATSVSGVVGPKMISRYRPLDGFIRGLASILHVGGPF